MSKSQTQSKPSIKRTPKPKIVVKSQPADFTSQYDEAISELGHVTDPYENNTANGFGRSDWSHIAKHTERSIITDLLPYPFPNDIKNQADVIYNKMYFQVRRGKVRDQMLFYCVYNAHLELGRDVNHQHLGKQFNLTPGEIQRCYSIFSFLQTGYRPPFVRASPLSYLPDYCKDIGLSQDVINDIKVVGNAIMNKDKSLEQENPQTVAAGILRYYLIANGIQLADPSVISIVTQRSAVTIDTMFRRVQIVDNN